LTGAGHDRLTENDGSIRRDLPQSAEIILDFLLDLGGAVEGGLRVQVLTVGCDGSRLVVTHHCRTLGRDRISPLSLPRLATECHGDSSLFSGDQTQLFIDLLVAIFRQASSWRRCLGQWETMDMVDLRLVFVLRGGRVGRIL
jgi:hypothetical protein